MSLAVKCHQAGDLQSAERLYQQVLRISPQHADAWHLLGVVAQQCGYLREAVGLIDQAIQHNNRVAQYHFNRGVCLQELGETQKAIAGYQTAVRLKPAYPEAYDNLGVALQDCDRLDEAIEAHRKALSYNPESLLAHNNLGTLLQKTGETDKALAHFRQALDLHPAEPGTRMKLAVAQLAKGNLSVGWREYEWRHYSSDFRTNNAIRIRPYAKWDGSDLSECTVLAYSEQGIGDEVMFAGCLQELATLANHCLLECDPRLVRLFARSFPEVSVLAREPGLGWNSKRPPPIDWSIPTGSLPRFFRNAPNDFPSRDCYLLADPDLEEKWRHKLAALPGNIKIGISWQGGIDPRAQCARSIPLDLWQGLFAVEDTCFVNLQYGDHRSEIEHFQGISPRQLVSFAELDPLKELDNFCALISVLDLVISIDNSTVHFAGALGTPTWALLPALADWRWMEKRTDSPWYRSVRLFRQKEPGPASRSAVLAEVEAGLCRFQKEVRPAPSISVRNSSTGVKSHDLLSAEHEAETPRPAKALLLNDTSFWYHWGCTCTSLAIHHELRNRRFSVASAPIHTLNNLQGLPPDLAGFDDPACFDRFRAANEALTSAVAEADVIVINGEGTLHDLHSGALGLLYLAYLAKQGFGKNVQIINHSCYPESGAAKAENPAGALYRKVYEQLDFIAIREPASSRLFTEMGIKHVLSFDCLPLFVEKTHDHSKRAKQDSIVIAGSVAWQKPWLADLAAFATHMRAKGLKIKLLIGANAYPAVDDLQFVQELHRLLKCDYELVNAVCETEWLDTLASARLLVSGRFHHSIAAAFVGTPFVALGTNTPKLQGLLSMLGLEQLALPRDRALADGLVTMGEHLLRNPQEGLSTSAIKAELLTLSRKNFIGLEAFAQNRSKDCL